MLMLKTKEWMLTDCGRKGLFPVMLLIVSKLTLIEKVPVQIDKDIKYSSKLYSSHLILVFVFIFLQFILVHVSLLYYGCAAPYFILPYFILPF